MKHSDWTPLTVKLVILVGLSLFLPLFVGVVFDLFADSAPLGTLFGMLLGIFLATILVIRTIQARYLTLAPLDESDEDGANKATQDAI